MSTYWLSNFCLLFSFNINPFQGSDRNERYNALTRLIILVTIIAYILTRDQNVLIAGTISVIITVLIYLFTFNSSVSFKTVDDYAQKDNVLGYHGDIIKLPATPNISGSLHPNDPNAAENLLQGQYDNAMENATPLGKQLYRDDLINARTGMSLGFVPRNREDDSSQVYFMKGNQMPNFAKSVRDNPPHRDPANYFPLPGKTIQTGTVKQFDSMMGRNLAHTASGASNMSGGMGLDPQGPGQQGSWPGYASGTNPPGFSI